MANDTHLITKATSDTVFPPVKSPTIALAIKFAPKKHMQNDTIENILIIFFEYLNMYVFSFNLPNVLYSLVILLIAKGIPAEDIIRKKLYML